MLLLLAYVVCIYLHYISAPAVNWRVEYTLYTIQNAVLLLLTRLVCVYLDYISAPPVNWRVAYSICTIQNTVLLLTYLACIYLDYIPAPLGKLEPGALCALSQPEPH